MENINSILLRDPQQSFVCFLPFRTLTQLTCFSGYHSHLIFILLEMLFDVKIFKLNIFFNFIYTSLILFYILRFQHNSNV